MVGIELDNFDDQYVDNYDPDYMDSPEDERKASCCCFWLRTCPEDQICWCVSDQGRGRPNNWFLNCCANMWGTWTFLMVCLAIAAGIYSKDFVGNSEGGFIKNLLKKMEDGLDYFEAQFADGGSASIGTQLENIDMESFFLDKFVCANDPTTDAPWALGTGVDITAVTTECQSSLTASPQCDSLTLPTCKLDVGNGQSLPAWFGHVPGGYTGDDVCNLRVVTAGYSQANCNKWHVVASSDWTAIEGKVIPTDSNVDANNLPSPTEVDIGDVTWDRGTANPGADGQLGSGSDGVDVTYDGKHYKAYAVTTTVSKVEVYGPWATVPTNGDVDAMCTYDAVNRADMVIPIQATGGSPINLKTWCKDVLKIAEDALAATGNQANQQVQGQISGVTGQGKEMIAQMREITDTIPIDWIAFGLCLAGALIVLISMLLFCYELRDQVKSDDRDACCGFLCCFCCPFWFLISTILTTVTVVVFFAQAVIYSDPFGVAKDFLDPEQGPMSALNRPAEEGGPDYNFILDWTMKRTNITMNKIMGTNGEEQICTDENSFFAISEINCATAEKLDMFSSIGQALAAFDACVPDDTVDPAPVCENQSDATLCNTIPGCSYFTYSTVTDCDGLLPKCVEMGTNLGYVDGPGGKQNVAKDNPEFQTIIADACQSIIGISVDLGDPLTEDCKTFVWAFYFAVVSNGMLAALSLWGILLALWTGCKACMSKD